MTPAFLITGTSGFLGKPLAEFFLEKQQNVIGLQRSNAKNAFLTISLPDFFETKALESTIQNTKSHTFIHCAARAHKMTDKKDESTRQLYLKENEALTKNLGEIAAGNHVQHFIFISSVAAYPFDPKEPQTPKTKILKERWGFYGESKFLAEQALRNIEANSNMCVTILRPPLIYGPQVKGNLHTLIRFAKKGIPLPFATISTLKSMISVRNFSDLIWSITQKKESWGKTYFVKDYDIPLNGLLNEMYINLHKPSRLFPFPKSVLTFLSEHFSFASKLERLTQELIVDDTDLRKHLDWTPPFSFSEEINLMVNS